MSPTYDFSSAYPGLTDSDISAILTVYGTIIGVGLLFALISFLIKGFGLYGIAKKLGVPNAFMAFIPYASSYLQGDLAGKFTIGKKRIKNPGVWTLVYPFIYGAVFVVFYFAMAASMIFSFSGFDPAQEPDFSTALGMMRPMFSLMLIFILLLIAGQAIRYAIFGVVRFQIHRRFMDDAKATVNMVMGLFIPLYQPILFLVLSRRTPLSPAVFPDPLPPEPFSQDQNPPQT